MVEGFDKIWSKVASNLKERLGELVFEKWILPLRVSLKDNDIVELEAPDNFFKEWVESHYNQVISDTLAQTQNKNYTFKFTVGKSDIPQTKIYNHFKEMLKEKGGDRPDAPILNPRYTFANFVVGPSNRHAYAYSLAVAESPAKIYNPLFIYGGVGLGKTHLMQAVCQYILSKTPQIKISYLPSEKFTNELIDAIQHKATAAFRQKYRNIDVLVIDDVHFFAGKESTQEEFFHTFNTLYDTHKQIIISSDRPPKEINNLQDRLVSRFGWGLTTDIQPPDLETRVAILKKKIERESIFIPEEVIFFIANLVKTNIRELEGALIRVIANSWLEETPVSLESAKSVLKDLVKEPKKTVTIDFIQRVVAEEFRVSLQDLKIKRRTKNIVLPRQVAMYLSRELTDLSLPEIGVFFGGKDHTTVLHSYNKIKERVKIDLELNNKIQHIINIIKQ